MEYNCPFRGKIELTKVGETSMHAMGFSKISAVYSDNNGTYYIETKLIGELSQPPMVVINSEVVDIIKNN